jgi:hypothetical protein
MNKKTEEKQASLFIKILTISLFFIFFLLETFLIKFLFNYLESFGARSWADYLSAIIFLFLPILTIYSAIKMRKNKSYSLIFFNNLIVGILLILWEWIDNFFQSIQLYSNAHYLVYIGILLIISSIIIFFRAEQAPIIVENEIEEIYEKKRDIFLIKTDIRSENFLSFFIVGLFLIITYPTFFSDFSVNGDGLTVFLWFILYLIIVIGFPILIQRKINRNAIIKNDSFKFYYFLIWYITGLWALANNILYSFKGINFLFDLNKLNGLGQILVLSAIVFAILISIGIFLMFFQEEGNFFIKLKRSFVKMLSMKNEKS